jgi:lipoic acid synthetase
MRDVRCGYDRSLDVLRRAKERARASGKTLITKSSIMVGCGETDDEVTETLCDLRAANVDLVTIGQYLRPTPKHAPVVRFVEPERFDAWAAEARAMGFAFAASGPLVRSSYKAAEVFVKSVLRPGDPTAASALLAERLAEARRVTGTEAELVPVERLVRRV